MDSSTGRIRSVHLAILVALLVAPAIACFQFAGTDQAWFLGGWAVLVSGLTAALYAVDKRRASNGGPRRPEAVLHLLELAGGWPGAFLAQQRLRHKSSKLSYQFVFWLIVALHQFIAIDYLLHWPMCHAAWAAVSGKR